MNTIEFGFKEFLIWQKVIAYTDYIIVLSENLNTSRKLFGLIEPLESSGLSVTQNITEGKGRHSKKEFIHFLYISRGSLYETITLLNLFAKRKWITQQQLDQSEKLVHEIASMLKGYIDLIYKNI